MKIKNILLISCKKSVCPLLNKFFLQFVYFPVWWACFACSNICTCLKAFSRVVAYDVRPNENLTYAAEACMLLLIELSKICFSIQYIICVVINNNFRHTLEYCEYITHHYSQRDLLKNI